MAVVVRHVVVVVVAADAAVVTAVVAVEDGMPGVAEGQTATHQRPLEVRLCLVHTKFSSRVPVVHFVTVILHWVHFATCLNALSPAVRCVHTDAHLWNLHAFTALWHLCNLEIIKLRNDSNRTVIKFIYCWLIAVLEAISKGHCTSREPPNKQLNREHPSVGSGLLTN